VAPAVLGPARFGFTLTKRRFLPETARDDANRPDPQACRVVANRDGAPIAERQVVFRRASLIAVPFDEDARLRPLVQPRDVPLQRRPPRRRSAGSDCARLIVIEHGEVPLSAAVDASAPPPVPPGCRRLAAARREAFTVASFDRLRVLTTELKRLIAAGAPVALRLGVGRALDESRLASALWWV
jgi:hypothetical protein